MELKSNWLKSLLSTILSKIIRKKTGVMSASAGINDFSLTTDGDNVRIILSAEVVMQKAEAYNFIKEAVKI